MDDGIVFDDDQCGLIGIVLNARIHQLEKTIKIFHENYIEREEGPSRFQYIARLNRQKDAITVVKDALHSYRIGTYHEWAKE